ncbi:MAG: sigma-54-dependent Fis family transcriptional regulator [Deltaproteobacteria bacterium]|nr:sigma-54-dependent Fis family transcriptional regulator [Deltaproteobacteria bacterium]
MTSPTAPRVLVVDDEESIQHMLSLALSKNGFHVWTAASGREGLEVLRAQGRFDVCVTDVRMPGMDGLAFIEEGTRLGDRAPTFIAMSAFGDEKLAVEALRRGAFDYISKPFNPEDLNLKLKLVVERRAIAKAQERPSSASRQTADLKLPPKTRQPDGISGIVSASPKMEKIFWTIRKVANVTSTVLITGETGTGKERVAGAIHAEGHRAGRPFVAVNCGAIPEALLESELFGHMKGAFTDATHDHIGLFEVASGGTIFLDEIAELPLQLQVKLLRVLNDKEIRRVGDNRNTPVDVRVIAATARDLFERVREEAFREDLYYRLNVVTIDLPPLRDRREDIAPLIDHFVQSISDRLGFSSPEITASARDLLIEYRWPGNVRELENAIERALVLSEGDGRITIADLDDRFDRRRAAPDEPLDAIGHDRGGSQTGRSGLGADPSAAPGSAEEDLSLRPALDRVEQAMILKALARTGGNRTRAATVLGISHRALLYKLKQFNIA